VTAAAARHIAHSRVAWVDTDAGGRIHFTAAFRWAEAAETALLRTLGLLEGWADYPRRAVEAEYLAVLRFEDEFELELAVERLGRSSITYGWEIRRTARSASAAAIRSSTSTPTAGRRHSAPR
jgi:acyl-CoA thioester hydrolase